MSIQNLSRGAIIILAEKYKISIIVPVYNVEKEIHRCINSLINQTYSNIEIILVDDESPDSCPEICDLYKEKDQRIKVIHKKNGGLSSSRNAGLKIASGEYIMYVDSDDYIELDACQNFMNKLDENADFIVGECKEILDDNISYQKHTNLQDGTTYDIKEYIINSIQKSEWYAPAWLNLYKKDFLLKNNLFFKEGIFFEDMEMLPRLGMSAVNVQYRNLIFYNYIKREGSITESSISMKKIDDIIDVYGTWLKCINLINDAEIKKYVSGVLVKYYLFSCRKYKIKNWKLPELNYNFAKKNALTYKEKLKVMLFNYFPMIYVKI